VEFNDIRQRVQDKMKEYNLGGESAKTSNIIKPEEEEKKGSSSTTAQTVTNAKKGTVVESKNLATVHSRQMSFN
jgi:hypothetical protein